jgi:large subunit ribosomal protein L25
MSEQLAIEAKLRSDLGKGASRRLRRNADTVPAIIYGAGKDPAPLTMIRKDLEKALENEAFFSQVIDVNVDGDVQPAILKDLQRHPAKDRVMHADFLRVDAKKEIKVSVPLHFINEEKCHGVKIEGGIIEHLLVELEVQCLPGLIPEYIEVDMLDVTTADIIHISDLNLPEGVDLHGPGPGSRPRHGCSLCHRQARWCRRCRRGAVEAPAAPEGDEESGEE